MTNRSRQFLIRLRGGIAIIALGAASIVGAQTVTMKLSTSTVGDAGHEWMKLFKAGIEPRAGGKIKVELYPASQLGQIPRTIEGVMTGTIEFAINATGFYETVEPRFSVFATPGLFDSIEHANLMLKDPAMQARLATFGAPKGVEALVLMPSAAYSLLSHKPVMTLADLKGQKIRVPGSPIQIEGLKRLGAAPLSMPLGEVLPALQNRTIDAVWAAVQLFNAFKYHDVAKSLTNLPAGWAVVVGLVNRNFMKSLGPELEAMVRDEAQKAATAALAWTNEDLKRADALWVKNGGKLIDLPPADAKRYIDESLAAALPLLTGTPGQKEDYEAFVDAAKKYRK